MDGHHQQFLVTITIDPRSGIIGIQDVSAILVNEQITSRWRLASHSYRRTFYFRLPAIGDIANIHYEARNNWIIQEIIADTFKNALGAILCLNAECIGYEGIL